MISTKPKKKIVKKVFDKVYDDYDVMNDIMSLGSHRVWKKEFVKIINAKQNEIILDMSSGTGDIARLICDHNEYKQITRIDPNYLMLQKGTKFFKMNNKVFEICATAEEVPIANDTVDTYAISFGIRNTYDTQKALDEAYRITKKGGKFACLEFFKITKPILKDLYRIYSSAIPAIGEIVVGDRTPYEYLTESIKNFYTQDEFKNMLEKSKFKNVNYINLMAGIVSIHTGWKI
jgi:demethylmenaquinone methyltransferase/2-methoxy-6-polyprenyl-1,4-benzoquinol methylase